MPKSPEQSGKGITPQALREALRQFAATKTAPGQRRFLQVEAGMTVVGIEEDTTESETPKIIEDKTVLHEDISPQKNDFQA